MSRKMNNWGTVLVRTILLVGLLVAQAAANHREASVAVRALTEFKRGLGGAGQVLPSWRENASVPSYCVWEGVRCSTQHRGRVVGLSLPGKGLQGRISPSLSNLTFLRNLDLSNNSLNGEIPSHLPPRLESLYLTQNHLSGPLPPSLSSLSRLKHLALHINSLYGSVPTQLSNCTQLQYLDLSQNHLSGSIPAALGDLPLLQALNLYVNNFSGPIPATLGNCTQLASIDLSENQKLIGSIPLELGAISFTAPDQEIIDVIQRYPIVGPGTPGYLDFSRNSFTGEIPFALGNCSGLGFLFLHFNKLNGSIPQELGKLTNLQYLFLTGNQLTGHIPRSLGNLAHLQILQLNLNQLRGTMPESLTNLPSLSVIDLGINHLRGALPQKMGSLASLQYLDLADNEMSGALPASLANCTQLQQLYLHNNTFNGPLPSFLAQLPNLQRLDLSTNQFTGGLPTSFINASGILRLSIAQNNVSGRIPTVFGTLSSVELLDLHGNQLKGPIPSELGGCTRLSILSLQSNSLQGLLPPELGQNLSSLAQLHLQWNALWGDIPHSLGNSHSLMSVDLSYNSFTGSIPITLLNGFTLSCLNLNLSHNLLTETIPDEVRNLKGIQSIDFSFNKLSGEIPATFGECTNLKALNLSHNSLNGSIPGALGQLRNLVDLELSANNVSGKIPASLGNFTAASFSDNPGLCGPPLTVVCRPAQTAAKWKMSKSVFAAIICGIVGAVLIFSGFFLWCNKYKNAGRCRFSYQDSFKDSSLRVTAEELEVATRGFDDENLLGSGGTSKVYKATVKDGLVVAVKKFNLETSGEEADYFFRKECETLECAELNHYSVKGDIYSYGVVLLCMLTQKQPTSELFFELGIDMPTWVRRSFPDRFLDAVNPALRDEVEVAGKQVEVSQFMEVALLCTARNPAERPTSKQVVKRLLQIKGCTFVFRNLETTQEPTRPADQPSRVDSF